MESLDEFYKRIGFQKYPFRDRTAEKEKSIELFIAPPDFAVIKDAYDSKETTIISGNRGTGKTKLLENIKKDTSSETIIVNIENYESVQLTDNLLDFYSLILQNLISETLVFLTKHKKALNKLSKDEKVFLSFLIMKYADSITDCDLAAKIESVQLNAFKRLINRVSLPLTSFLNFGTTVVANFGHELLNRHFCGYLPAVNEEKIRKIIPDIYFNVDDGFKSVGISYSLLDKALSIVKKIQGEKPIIIFDKFDEDSRLDNDADLTADFIKHLLSDNKLLLNENVQLFISVWEIPFSSLLHTFRQSKHTVFNIHWNRDELEMVLNRRLSVYSHNKIENYRLLFADDVTDELVDKLFVLSNMNPRDLWAVFDSIFIEQYKIDSQANKLSATAIENGMVSFVKGFSFYEYYPKKKNARKTTNDVYSYIRHLLQLDNTDEFTQDELREAASTGGSTTNYITGMMNIGLVKKTDNKRPGGAVIYKVHDPKISFAILSKIDIEH